MRKFLLTLLFASTPLLAAQTVIANYDSARDDWFWDKLYTYGGYSLYCNTPFNNAGHYINHKNKRKKMTLEHVYPADWIASFHGCNNRHSCEIDDYKFAEADLHNLWPAQGNVNSSRSDHLFSELPDTISENRYAKKGCADFERNYRVADEDIRIEPRDEVKGAIARSLLYMADEYGLPLHGMREMLLIWNRNYPVSFEELWRNRQIEALQGTRNHWIATPE